MTQGPATLSQGASPSARAVRIWTGVLTAVWVAVLCGAVIICYERIESHAQTVLRQQADNKAEAEAPLEARPAGYHHAAAVALASAALAMLFIVAGVGLMLGAPWSWRLLLAGAVMQILVTLATQVWQAALPVSTAYGHFPDGRLGMLGAAIGILLWNVVPVGILILAVAGGKRPGQTARAGTCS